MCYALVVISCEVYKFVFRRRELWPMLSCPVLSSPMDGFEGLAVLHC
jgi:hypothetical protein